jgi:hypothetical protein
MANMDLRIAALARELMSAIEESGRSTDISRELENESTIKNAIDIDISQNGDLRIYCILNGWQIEDRKGSDL